jgi:CxxC motif-containing protein
MGCHLIAENSAHGELAVSGNRCPRGAAYAREELLAPKRTVTATCRAHGGNTGTRRVPVKTTAAFPKDRVDELLTIIYQIEAELPVERGQVLLPDALDLGIDVVATRTVR